MRSKPPEPGSLGSVLDVLQVAAGEGGAVAVMASRVLLWLRNRRGDFRLKLTRADGSSMELSAGRVRDLDPEAMRRLAAEIGEALDDRPAEPPQRP